MRPLILLALLILASSLPNQAPIIGIFTQSVGSDEPVGEMPARPVYRTLTSNYSYIAASYVKYIQMSGAQVVPLFGYSSKAYFDEILPKLNGVLFPGKAWIIVGGDVDLDINTTWTQNAEYILKYAINQNQKGNVFPLWGTCLGMQLLAYLTSGYDAAAVSAVSGEVATKNTLQIQPNTVLYKGISDELKYYLENGRGVTYFNHHFAVRKEYFERSALLRNFWEVESYTTTTFQ